MRRVLPALVAAVLLGGCTSSATPPPPSPSASPSSTSSPSPPAIPAGEQRLHLQVAGEARQLLVERPQAGAHRLPLIVFLHGSRSSGQEIRDRLGIDSAAAAAGVLMAYPDGATGSWRSGCCNAFANSDADFAFLTEIIDRFVADGEADPHRILLAGFSAGAFLANAYACRSPEKLSVVVAVSGTLLEPPSFLAGAAAHATRCAPQRPVTMLAVNGTADTTVPVGGADAGCESQPCEPGVNEYVAPAMIVNSWWRELDHCAAPAVSTSGGIMTSLAACADGTHVGLALIRGVGHDVVQLNQRFGLGSKLIALALGRPITSW